MCPLFNQNALRSCLRLRTVGSAYGLHLFKHCIKNATTTSIFRNCFSSLSNPAIPITAHRQIGKWLLGCSGMVFGAVILGGATRLTESGLSMVDWHMFKERPPLSNEDWEIEFAKYQEFPEYKFKHNNITLKEFKWIWYMEFIHRTWGRAIGAFFTVPAAYFWYKGYFKRPTKIRVVIFGSLIAFQGLLGWYMVKSGLEEKQNSHDIPRVSQHRLAMHLGTAFVLYSLLLWSSLNFLVPLANTSNQNLNNLRKFWWFSLGTKGLIFTTVISGAFVAGLGAGLTYNTFPKMANKWIPDDILALDPVYKNFTNNPTTVQFIHRILGSTTGAYVFGLWLYSRTLPLPPKVRMLTNAVAGITVIQVALGISTLLFYVPIPLAILHQAGALTLLSATLWLGHEAKALRLALKI